MRHGWLTIGWTLVWLGCGGGGGGGQEPILPAGDASGSGATDAAQGDSGEQPSVPVDAVDLQATFAQEGKQHTVYETRYVPQGCTSDHRCPGIVLVGDPRVGGDVFFGAQLPGLLAAKTGTVVLVYNPPGTGKGGRRSTGDEDQIGPLAIGALRAVTEQLVKTDVTNDRVGIVAFGEGLLTAAATLAKFQESNLQGVSFLIDVEGPANRCYATEHPTDPDAGIEADGPGPTQARCDFDLAPRDKAFPFDMGPAPAPTVCNTAVYPLDAASTSCEDDDFWLQRDPKSTLRKLHGAYLRIQMKYDHARPTRWGALVATRHAAASPDVTWTQLNDVEPNTPVWKVGDESCATQGCYLDIPGLGNSIAWPSCDELGCTPSESPYAAAFDGFVPMSFDAFMLDVLPGFVTRMVQL